MRAGLAADVAGLLAGVQQLGDELQDIRRRIERLNAQLDEYERQHPPEKPAHGNNEAPRQASP